MTSNDPSYQDRIEAVYDGNQQITGDKVTILNHQQQQEQDDNDENKTSLPTRMVGKVRDRYDLGNGRLALVTTDRQSGFDRMLALVPFKGRVLNLTSAYWFDQTKDILPNHLISVPHPNVSIVRKCKPFPIEFVVRAYLTGSTSTSIWKNYENGVRNYCGHELPNHMKKNQILPKILLTPTTKEETHDRPISEEEIISEGWMTREDWDVCSQAVLRVFQRGQEIASQHGLILVDTKYELGKDESNPNTILLIDEVHTPDSSRYWIASSYQERFDQGLEPENIDKEFLRLWFAKHCDPYKDVVLPVAPKELVVELSRRYIQLYEMITHQKFPFIDTEIGGKDESDTQTKGSTEEQAIAKSIRYWMQVQ